jgi:hypothetical protein
MLGESVAAQQGNLLEAAKEHIHLGPVPDWVVPCSFRMDFKPEQPGHVTHLFASRQIHAEKHQSFVHTAIRLETIQAVQNEAQGRIAFEPRSQIFTLHWLKIHRAGTVFDHTSLGNIRCAHQESDGFASPHRLTLLLLLEDVRPGDVLDLSYTMEEQPILMPEYCGCLFSLPQAPLGKLYFSIRFQDSRQVRWKSSAPDLQPVRTQQGGQTLWVWRLEDFPGSRAEENTPSWHISHSWIQVSDCPDWKTVAAAFARSWDVDKANANLAAMMPEIAAGKGDISRQTQNAIQWVQDQCRYLTLDGELDGQPPTAPEVVARRRYGYGKDLSVLLMALLRSLGLEARLTVVNTHWRKSLAALLPMPSLFDHIAVEYKTQGEIRWVDATVKGQGGDLLNRVIRDFGVGLPVTRDGPGLIEAPELAVESNVYQIKESVLLDTSGEPSMLGIVIMARGSHAEDLRREFEKHGAGDVARRRLQKCVDRFIDVKRVGALEYRDNRADNEFFLAEVFEIKNFLKEDSQSSWFKLEVSAEIVANLLPMPIAGLRHSPLALPHPRHVVHIMEVYCVALPPALVKQRKIENPWLRFTRLRKTLAGYWMVTTTLSTLTDAIEPDEIDEYREAARQIRLQSNWTVLVPEGQERPYQRSDFGRLPVSWEASAIAFPRLPRAVAVPIPPMDPQLEATKPSGAPSFADSSEESEENELRRKKRHRRRHENKLADAWLAVLAGLLAVVVLLLGITLFKRGGIFTKSPQSPAQSQTNH